MKNLIVISIFWIAVSCQNAVPQEQPKPVKGEMVKLEAENYTESSVELEKSDSTVIIEKDQWAQYRVDMPLAGRYAITVYGQGDGAELWLEDHVINPDDRTYDISGKQKFENGLATMTGSPMNGGEHVLRLHVSEGQAEIDRVEFRSIRNFRASEKIYTQNMEGDEWELVWSDEFNGSGLPDTSKWTYNVGDWGWGNNELQYYTDSRLENARQENGSLIIEAHKNDEDYPWSSARLTTQGRQSFLYGKIEFRAKVPPGRGAWAAGWLLGETYRDELSWPYCGEIDVLECVGYEINDTTGEGVNHATCHTRKYYFKQGNQIGEEIAVDSMFQKFHNYTIEWYPDRIEAFLDGEHYYTYDKNADELEWPFFEPQNIIVNIAVGGGWGGAKGVDPNWEHHRYELDYVRVYQKK